MNITNVRDPKSGAIVHPQYNMCSVMYRLYTQIFESISSETYPDYIRQHIADKGITKERIAAQQRLISDMLDGLLEKQYQREEGISYVRAAMNICKWSERFDWEAMAVFDMLASQSMIAYWFNTVADLFNEADIRAQSPGELRSIIDSKTKEAVSTVCGDTPENEEPNSEEPLFEEPLFDAEQDSGIAPVIKGVRLEDFADTNAIRAYADYIDWFEKELKLLHVTTQAAVFLPSDAESDTDRNAAVAVRYIAGVNTDQAEEFVRRHGNTEKRQMKFMEGAIHNVNAAALYSSGSDLPTLVNNGDWLVKPPNDSIIVMTNEAFGSKFGYQ
jgi:hypothetical protein